MAGGVGALIVVTDANIRIQLEDGGLTADAFLLGEDLLAPEEVVMELGPVLGPKVVELGLPLLTTGDALEAEWQGLRERHNRPSDVDLYGLLHALVLGCRLLTGDRHLREAGEAEGVKVSGLLWLLDRLVAEAVVTGRAARQSLQAIRDRGARLPADECDRRLGEWGRA